MRRLIPFLIITLLYIVAAVFFLYGVVRGQDTTRPAINIITPGDSAYCTDVILTIATITTPRLQDMWITLDSTTLYLYTNGDTGHMAGPSGWAPFSYEGYAKKLRDSVYMLYVLVNDAALPTGWHYTEVGARDSNGLGLRMYSHITFDRRWYGDSVHNFIAGYQAGAAYGKLATERTTRMVPYPSGHTVVAYSIYADTLMNGWTDTLSSWGTVVNRVATDHIWLGRAAYNALLANDMAALRLSGPAQAASAYSHLEMKAYTDSGNTTLIFRANYPDTPNLATVFVQDVPRNFWTYIQIPVAALLTPDGTLHSLCVQQAGTTQRRIWLDNIRFTK